MIFGIFKKKKVDYRKAQDLLVKANDAFHHSNYAMNVGERNAIAKKISDLDVAVFEKNDEKILEVFEDVKKWATNKNSRRFKIKNFLINIILDLVIPAYFLSSWIGLSFIPTGSMRFALMECDKAIISKFDFNNRFYGMKQPYYFNFEGLPRGSVTMYRDYTQSVDGAVFKFMKTSSTEIVKRCVGLPGDHVYFYGGKVFVVDKNGVPQKDFLKFQEDNDLFYVPFDNNDPKYWKKTHSSIYDGTHIERFYWFNKLIFFVERKIGKNYKINWQTHGKDICNKLNIWGSGNFGMCKLFKLEDAKKLGYSGRDDVEFVLCIRHSPILMQGTAYENINISYSLSFIPLPDAKVLSLAKCIDLFRITIDSGSAVPWELQSFSQGKKKYAQHHGFINIPNGSYDIKAGVIHKLIMVDPSFNKIPIFSFLFSKKMEEHALRIDKGNILEIFNFYRDQFCYGLSELDVNKFPCRYAYFRNGNLFIDRYKFLDKNDAILKDFVYVEKQLSNQNTSYNPFIDQKSPVNDDGTWDIAFIKENGIAVPNNQCMLLGDNVVVSFDSRHKGFININDMEGRLLFVPFTFDKSRIVVKQPPIGVGGWVCRSIFLFQVLMLIIAYRYIYSYRYKYPIFKLEKISDKKANS